MSSPVPMTDLVILTADKNCQFALRGLLTRSKPLRMKSITVDFHTHPGRDAGLLRGAPAFLRSFLRSHRHALVVLDREGCGLEQASREELEAQVERHLTINGWEERACAIVIDPELEVWVWSDSPHVDAALGWTDRAPSLQDWLVRQQWLNERGAKPARPKEALEAALRQVRKPRSSAIYQALAEKVGLSRCTDPAFQKLRNTLQNWFPE